MVCLLRYKSGLMYLLKCQVKAPLLSKLCLAALLLLSVSFPAASVDLLGLRESDFSIQTDNSALTKILQAEMARQRTNNKQLKLYTSRAKKSRLEAELLTKRLHAEGYYDGSVKVDMLLEKTLYQVESGELYRVESIDFDVPSGIPGLSMSPSVKSLPLKVGQGLVAERVLAARKVLQQYIEKNHCFYRVEIEPEVVISRQNHSAKVVYVMQPSAAAVFGYIDFKGLKTVSEEYLVQRLAFKPGQCFKQSSIEASRAALLQTNLLSSSTIRVDEPKAGQVDVHFVVQERRHRTLSSGVGYDFDDGAGVSLGWENRNLFGRAEKIETEIYVAQRRKTLSGNITLPHYPNSDQSVSFYSEVEDEETDAYDALTGTVGVEFNTPLTKSLAFLVGSEMEFSTVTDNQGDESYALMSVFVGLNIDRRDNVLNPKHGWNAVSRLQFYQDAYDSTINFWQPTLAASAYTTFDQLSWSPTLAVRGAVGSTIGTDLASMPANVRFFSGGGGSVRGYAYQSLSESDPQLADEFSGGLSFTELSSELRVQWGKNWGGVLFLDGGYAFDHRAPSLDDQLLWGAGFGVRYYTEVIPVRFDVGFPLDRRDDIDDSFQIYISIGQAF